MITALLQLSLLVMLDAGAAPPTPPAQVTFTIDTARDVRPISPLIYGVNAHDAAAHRRPSNRLGGNRWTAYNWENNASNAGSDWHHQSDGYLSESDIPGQAVRPAVEAAARDRQALIITVPMAGYVAADKHLEGDVNQTPDYLNKRFHVSAAKKGAPLLTTPDLTDRRVYQDEFVNWVEQAARVAPDQQILYALDNEPDLWSHTHARIHPDKITYEELVRRTIEYAGAIKDVKPDAIVLGAVNYGWNGYRTLQNAPDADGRDFHQLFLAELKKAHEQAGRRLVDALDIHYYSEAEGGGVRVIAKDDSEQVAAARVQAPRSLWDPTYVESSWITRDSIAGKPIALIPRVLKDIDDHCPGTRLAITEYQFGGGDHVSGGIAQADALGIFGRYGVFAANWWNLGVGQKYVDAAFDLYLNYDGKGARFGNQSVFAESSSIETASVYASTDSADPSVVSVIAINRMGKPVEATIRIAHPRPLGHADVYRFTGESPKVASAGTHTLARPSEWQYAMPPTSASVIRFSGPR